MAMDLQIQNSEKKSSSTPFNKNQKKPLPVKTGKPTQNASGSKESRNAKRRRWAKQNKPKVAPKQVVKAAAPVFEYISACCSLPARKPKAAQKEVGKDPETGKMVNQVKGLGHWTCTGCSKKCKVSARKPQPKTKVPNGEVTT